MMTKEEALNHLDKYWINISNSDEYKECIEIAIECIAESITAEKLKNDLLNEFEGVPI